MIMCNFNYSIIIPHKNIPALLERCLNSIPHRDDIQIIVVDDNSDANIVDFNSFPGSNDSSVEMIFTKEGRGAGYARNVGLKHAKGKWLLFADADDFFNDGFLDQTDKYLDSDNDIIYWSINSVYSETLEPADRGMYFNQYIEKAAQGEENSRDYVRYKFLYPSAKMVRRSLVEENRISFDEVPASNDTMFGVKIGANAKKIAFDTFQLYCLTVRKNSLVTSYSYGNLRSRLNVSFDLYYYLLKIGKQEYAQSSIEHLLQIRHASYFKFFCDFFVVLRKLPFKVVLCQISQVFHRL